MRFNFIVVRIGVNGWIVECRRNLVQTIFNLYYAGSVYLTAMGGEREGENENLGKEAGCYQ